jgi:hypothetical protein
MLSMLSASASVIGLEQGWPQHYRRPIEILQWLSLCGQSAAFLRWTHVSPLTPSISPCDVPFDQVVLTGSSFERNGYCLSVEEYTCVTYLLPYIVCFSGLSLWNISHDAGFLWENQCEFTLVANIFVRFVFAVAVTCKIDLT